MNSAGFSLLEILVVIVITATLTAIGISSWRDMQDRNELSSVTLGLMEFLNEAKLDANLYNYNQNVYLLKTNDTIWCFVMNQDSAPINCEGALRFIPANNNRVEVIEMTNHAMLIFYGVRNSAKAATIRLKNRIGESRIIISAQSRIRYCSYDTYLSGFPQC